MTFQPPPPPPPPAGPPPGGQPPGQWGPPPGGPGGPGGPYRSPGSGFDPKTINPLDWGILGAGAFAFIFSFVSYYSYSISSKFCGGTCASATTSAWHGFFGWFAMLAALVGSAAVAITLFAPHVKLPVAPRLAALGAYALSALCVILAIFIVPGPDGYAGSGFDKGHGFGYWISLIVIIAGLVLCVMRFQQTGGQLPAAMANMPGMGGNRPGGPGPGGQVGPGGPPPQGPPPGYGPPPQGPPPGYGPPPGPPR